MWTMALRSTSSHARLSVSERATRSRDRSNVRKMPGREGLSPGRALRVQVAAPGGGSTAIVADAAGVQHLERRPVVCPPAVVVTHRRTRREGHNVSGLQTPARQVLQVNVPVAV